MVPDLITDFLEGLSLVTGIGVRNEVMIVEDMFSLLVGHRIQLGGFIELAFLFVLSSWGLESPNMPSAHSTITRSILNKTVYWADGFLGPPVA